MTTKLGYAPKWGPEHTKAVEKSLSSKGKPFTILEAIMKIQWGKKLFWKLIIYDNDFLSSLSNPGEISDLSKWRLQYFVKNLVETNSPLSKWHHETCPTHKSFHLFGLNDDGLGNKKLEILIQLDFDTKTLTFCMIEEIDKK